MGKYQEEVAKATKAYQATLKSLKRTLVGYDAAVAGMRFWRDLTGKCVDPHLGSSYVKLSVWMTDKTHGRFVTRRHFNELVEVVDDYLVAAGYDTKITFKTDSHSLDVTIACRDFFIVLESWHGGVCARKQVGTKTVEQPIYEVECA